MKVAINVGDGDFRLSNLGIKKFLELQDKKCYFYKEMQGVFGHAQGIKYVKIEPDNWDTTHIYVFTNDLGSIVDELPYNSRNEFHPHHEMDRTSYALIQTIETLGNLVNTSNNKLKVAEIPDGVEYTIHSSGTFPLCSHEEIREKYRVWK